MYEPYNPEPLHRRSIRLPAYNYAEAGFYFITLCAHDKRPIFGHIHNCTMHMNSLGKHVEEAWLETARIRCNIALHEYVVMPNHIHAIVEITFCRNANSARAMLSPAKTLGAVVRGFKSAVSGKAGFSVWQRNYYEHIIRDLRDYGRIADCIASNPEKWEDDVLFVTQ